MSNDLTTEEKAELLDWLDENWDVEINPEEPEKPHMSWTAAVRIYRLMVEDGERFIPASIEVKGLERRVQLSYVQSWADQYEVQP